MRSLALAAAVLTIGGFAATAAMATPASVSVTIGPELQLKGERTLGMRDLNDLAKSLQTDVEKKLVKTGAYDGARIELILVDAQPNRPTFKQLSDTPGLSMRSFGIGGAKIEGRAVAPDGRITPLAYDYYAPDIRWSRGETTWSDAEQTFQQFAAQLGRGKAVASR
ncbi:MAG: hypothetical protein ACXWKN_14465 [Phenylobacterium sp.]